jgi:hypothetical protein
MRLVALGPDAFLKTLLQKKMADIDEWQTEMQLKPMRLGRVQLYSTGLSANDHHATGVEAIDSISQAIGRSMERTGSSEIAIIPEGPYVVPFFSA